MRDELHEHRQAQTLRSATVQGCSACSASARHDRDNHISHLMNCQGEELHANVSPRSAGSAVF